ncbi:hypothetical protein LOZ16_005378 [Ophidiomyces ophidiicola]|nr:hypothetical protein LOZ59_000404 [Ophidiomyces ophidiicola]KAI2005706.1 hypothetical protein LOZ49_005314 [Ophidiomyces ophidiicola]KAI2146169.1 hypothetical protein LOZ27_003011 [Ophidiomyces ophidiicola]KAI2205122.1 hypothetical protein LOZ16_005378 [Ophidiomyces ophidiicola]KAI2306452.1 hypothetical protein LOZ06_003318 [Ophidiomyces ophidiicola]
MSYIVRRGLSTLIPPKIASPSAIGAAKDAARMERVGNFYGKLPRGPAPEVKPSGFFARYHAKHFGKTPTAKPLVHLIIVMTLLGYSIQYVTHLQNIVMAEQSSHDVVNQTRSGGDLSPSDVPASKPDKCISGGDEVDVQTHINNDQRQQNTVTTTQDIPDGNKITTQDTSIVTSKRLEMNGIEPAALSTDDTTISHLGDGGSDTDASRSDIRSSKDSAQHSRTSSVKRPASFKPVSFAKFSITKSPSTIPKSTVEQAPFSTSNTSSVPAQQTSRPRLVAKTTSGLSNSAPRSLGSGTRIGSSSPDPSQVWNKNRPAQPPPTKHLTDEELKQQYGIHMTSRIQADGDGKESKWADIDDDEDDWAPETIEWNDGTKISLTQTEPQSQTKNQTSGISSGHLVSTSEKALGSSDAKAPISKIGSLGPKAAILKLGGGADKHSKLAGDLNGEKEGQSSRSHAAKSPWAPLPPVDKIPPVSVNPPVPPSRSSRFFQGERNTLENTVPAALPAKEIAVDDFNRSWRDTQASAPRELFNSQSGRYEPVSETRRGQHRHDQQFRPSSLLQRPNHIEQLGPAEPSPAFQTNRSSFSQEPGPWSRRRASSNVSGGSGVMGRRLSMSKADSNHTNPNLPPPRRGSQHERSTSPRRPYQKGTFPARGPSPSGQPSQHISSQPVPGPFTPNTNDGVPPPPIDAPAVHGPPTEDTIAMQQRIMREKREMARQRRLDEEAKEEAAKQERIRLKLEAMGPPPTEKSNSKEPTSTTDSIKQSIVALSPPKPPVPEPSGEPKQYGMMKLHPPEPVKKLVKNEKDSKAASGPQVHLSPSLKEQKLDSSRPNAPPSMNGVRLAADKTSSQMSEHQQGASEKSLSWKGSIPTTASYSSWSGTKIGGHASGANLWGPLNNDRALGNGTFDRNLTGFPPRDIPPHPSLKLSDQPPIGPLAPTAERSGVPETAHQHTHSHAKGLIDSGTSMSPLPSPEQRGSCLATAETVRPISRPGPIAPPSSYSQGQKWQQNQFPPRSEQTSAWNNFHITARKSESEENERYHRDLQSRLDEEARSGIKPTLDIAFKETWRQVKVGDEPGQRHIVSVIKTGDKNQPPSLHNGETSAPDGLTFSESNAKFVGTTARGSRFFPHGSDHKRPPPSDRENSEGRCPSPPPPEEISSHPVFTISSPRPLVHLPTPKPRVRLPPRSSSPSAAPQTTFAAMVSTGPPPPRGSQPIASTATWQDRFNGLFGKKTAPTPPLSQPKKNAFTVTSASKEPLDVLSNATPAAVSLPQVDEMDAVRSSGNVVSKEVEDEEAIFEDREAGSLPVVKVPYVAPRAAWQPALPPSQQRFRSRLQRPVQTQTIEPYAFRPSDKDNNSIPVVINLPGCNVSKTLTLCSKSTVPGSQGQQRQRSQNFKHRKGAKPRESSGSQNTSLTSKKLSSPANSTSGSLRPHSGHNNWASRVAGTAT